MSLLRAFRAGFVQRWHTNPELSRTNDRVDGHSARVARIILMLHPNPTLRLIQAALVHDDGEIEVGDIKAPCKDRYRVISDALEEIEYQHAKSIWGDRIFRSDLSQLDTLWLKFADRLDAYMWAAHHAPRVLHGDGWPEARDWLLGQAYILQVSGVVADLISEMEACHATP